MPRVYSRKSRGDSRFEKRRCLHRTLSSLLSGQHHVSPGDKPCTVRVAAPSVPPDPREISLWPQCEVRRQDDEFNLGLPRKHNLQQVFLN
ncbi:granulocyte-macrophage colony-stimulating factor receptor subunit alpha isoform X2 [Piliocolobus tephrosceles]|uniref:granulocyte-macrophage colony-stimulating factor receptor subunit alpha isoform X2 n=1 Tax=Piliocolobus tephrosceles TaxID=591936 RepID=UPI000E6B4166|nr:granulocyte-macrophage colony-stimulating factor receptor subunit alpha isoform X2 [Piliocolobus tephrosceles]